jgi:serine/threonine-protein kinase HipA
MNGERVGSWRVRAASAQEFVYEPSWLSSPLARPISLSMPLRPSDHPYRGAVVAAFFDNLLPDSHRIRARLQQRFQLATTDAFDLLREIGRDCVGALQLLPGDEEPRNVRRIAGEPMTRPAVERLLSAVLDPAFGQRPEDFQAAFRISLAGAQEKTALLWHSDRWHLPVGSTPTTHILKLPIGTAHHGIDLSTSVENEWLCAQILRAFGLEAATCHMESFGRFNTLVVERFDRKLSDDARWWIRLPQEDFCQVNGVPPALKYESDGGPGIRRIMDLLLGSANAADDRRNFLRTQLVFWLLCAIDGHAKNFSVFLQPGGSFRLTPLYDVLSAHPVLGNAAGHLSPRKVKMAMAIEGASRHYRWNTIQRRHWIETARRCGMQSEMEQIIPEILDQVPIVIDTVGKRIPKDFPGHIAARIFDGVKRAARHLEVLRAWRGRSISA